MLTEMQPSIPGKAVKAALAAMGVALFSAVVKSDGSVPVRGRRDAVVLPRGLGFGDVIDDCREGSLL